MQKNCHKRKKKQAITNIIYIYIYFFFQENVILGSDYPFPLGEHHPGKLIGDVYKETCN